MKRFARISARKARQLLASSIKIATLCFTCALDGETFSEDTSNDVSPLFDTLTRAYSWMKSNESEEFDESSNSTREGCTKRKDLMYECTPPDVQEMETATLSLALLSQRQESRFEEPQTYWDERSADFEMDITDEGRSLPPPRILRNIRIYERESKEKVKGLFRRMWRKTRFTRKSSR